ncbi:mucin-1 isoform X1 [Octodon degus]|uniref:Mucin-1 isoform X1 n=1 Tax=Octodon degus TaxID=10160 RepID=A0A6P6DTB5_OCTDE|nr:mucin-1 isoform X1 [Octodon degus]
METSPWRRLLLILTLFLVLKSSGTNFPSNGETTTATETSFTSPTISSSYSSFSSPGDTSTPQSSSPGTEAASPSQVPTAQPSPSPAGSGTASGIPYPTTVTHSGSEFSSSAFTPVSDSASPIPPWIPPSSVPALGDTQTRVSHRNPGVVVAVCLLVSLVLIGSVLLVVRRRHRDTSEFLVLDEVSMDGLSRRLSITPLPPE